MIQLNQNLKQQIQIKMNSKLNLNNLDHLKSILNGAATTIQKAWRNHKSKPRIVLNNYKIDFSNINPDTLILVESKMYICHSYVLWVNSSYFRHKLQTYQDNLGYLYKNNYFKYKFDLDITSKNWKIIHRFLYGYKLDYKLDEAILDELLNASSRLGIEKLVNELNKLNFSRKKNT